MRPPGIPSSLLLIVLAVSFVTACARPDASVTADPNCQGTEKALPAETPHRGISQPDTLAKKQKDKADVAPLAERLIAQQVYLWTHSETRQKELAEMRSSNPEWDLDGPQLSRLARPIKVSGTRSKGPPTWRCWIALSTRP